MSEPGFKCDECGREFSMKCNLRRHQITVHKVKPTKNCPLCDEPQEDDLEVHVQSAHGLKLERKKLSFRKFEGKMNLKLLSFSFTLLLNVSLISDFEKWRSEQELEESVRFKRNKKRGNTIFFICNRSGRYTSKSASDSSRSVKIGRTCPTRIILKILDQELQVDYLKLHCHEPLDSLRRIHLSHECRLIVVDLLKAGASSETIIETIKRRSDPRSRDYHLNKDDIRNIRNRQKLESNDQKNQKPKTRNFKEEFDSLTANLFSLCKSRNDEQFILTGLSQLYSELMRRKASSEVESPSKAKPTRTKRQKLKTLDFPANKSATS